MSEIKKSDLIPENIDDEVKKITAEFNLLIQSIDGVVESGTKLNTTLKTGQKTREETQKLNETAVKNADTLNKSSVKLTNLQTNYTKSLVALNKQKEKEIKTNEKLTKKEKEHQAALKLVVKSEADAVKQNKALRLERSKLDKTTDEGISKAEEYNALIDANTELLQKNTDKNQERVNSIGLYEKALDNLPSILKDASNGFQKFNDGANAGKVVANNFIKVPLLLVIGLLVLAFVEVAAAVKKFQPVMDKIAQVSAGFSAGLEVLITSLGKVGKVILSNVVLSLQKMQAGVLKARIAWNEFTGDVEETDRLTKSLEEVNKAITETTAKIKQETEEAAESFKNMGENIAKAVKEGAAIKELEQRTEQFRITSLKTNATLEKQIAILERISDDATRSFKEREDAANKLDAAQTKLANNRLKEAKLYEEVELRTAKNIQANRQLTREEEEKLNTAIANRIQVETEAVGIALENEKRLSELKQDRLEKDLDILIDGFDNQKTINEKIIASDKSTLGNRIALLEETRKLAKDTFDEQVSTIQQFTDKSINANDLLATSDAKVLNAKIRNLGLSEIIEGRLLEVIRERRTVNQDLAESEEDLTDAILAEQEKRFQTQLSNSVNNNAKQLAETKKLYVEGAISAEEAEKRILENQDEAAKSQIDLLADILENTELTAEQRKTVEEKLFDAKLALFKKEEDATKETEAKKAEIREEYRQKGQQLTNELFEFNAQLNDNALTKLEEQQAYELELAGDNEEAQEAINEKYAKKKVDLARKQDIADKAQAIFNIALSTAKAIAEASPNPVLIALAAGLGAVQAATVLATPLPQYDKGTMSTPRDYEAGEKRPEFRKSKGKWSLVTEPTQFFNSPNDTIISGAETANILDNGLMQNMQLNGVIKPPKQDNTQMVKGFKSLEKAVNNNKTNVIFDKKGITEIYGQSRNKQTRIDKYLG